MRLASTLILVAWGIALSAAPPARTPRSAGPEERRADSLFDASAHDTLLVYAQRQLVAARARGDSMLVGRMTYHRGRAREFLRKPGGRADLDRALSLAVATDDTLGRINALGVLSFFAMVDGRLDDCLRLNHERIPLARAIDNRRNEAWGHLLVAYVHLLREDLPVARTEYEEALRGFRAAKRRPQELTALIGLARVYDRQGDVEATRDAYRRALAIAQEVGDKGQEADVWNNLATLEEEKGDLAVAERYYRRGYELKKAVGMGDLAVAAGNVAGINVLLGSYSAAESVLVDALPRTKEWNYTAGILGLKCDIGDIRLAQGRTAGAIECYRSALTVYGSIENRVQAATGLARALLKQGDAGQAVAVLDTHCVDLPRVTPSEWRAQAYVVYASALRAAGDIPRAGRMARAAWDDAGARADTTQGIVAATELGTCLRAADQTALGYQWFQRARAMYVAQAPRASEFRLREAHRVSLAEPLLALSTVLLEWPLDAKRDERERRLFDFVQEVKARTLLERIADPRHALGIDASFSTPATATDIQSVLHEGECLLDYTLAGDGMLAFAVTNTSLHFERLADAGQTEKQVSRYHRLLAQPPRHSREPEDVRAAARSLGTLLFEGKEDVVRGSSRVYVAPDGWLAALPIETLVCPDDGDVPLLFHRDVVRIPSATLLRLQRGRPPRPYHAGEFAAVLAVASQTEELHGARRETNRLATRYGNVERPRQLDREAFIDAIGESDVVHVASHVRVDAERPWYSGVLITRDAPPPPDEASGVPVGAVRADTRAAVQTEDSLAAAVISVDPYARAAQIASARSDARLVVLSGCESALGRATQGEGVLGIAAAFFAAGARSVVASIWEVDDRVTAELMEHFYKALAQGKTVASALRTAQVELQSKRPHPFYWAGFVVIGDGDVTVRLEPRHGGSGHFWIAALAVTVMAALTWVFTRRAKV